MRLFISLADFADYTVLSANLPAALVEPYIRDAQRFDVWPLLPAQVQAQLAEPTTSWAAATAALFAERIRPLLVLESAARLLLWHGTHVTPAGLEELTTDLNRTPASGARRAALAADLQAKAAHYRAALLAVLPRSTSAGCGADYRRRPGRGGLAISAL